MKLIKKNYGWMIVAILALLPLMPLTNLLQQYFFSGTVNGSEESILARDMLYHISGEFAIRWMTAVLTLTPFFILFGITNLFVRQAMGIATAFWSFLHFILFLLAEGLLETFTQVNYVAGFIAVLILIPLFFTSNRKSMKRLKTNWKKLQRFVYLAIFLSILHVAILDKTWMVYALVVGVGFIFRIPIVKSNLIAFRVNRKNVNS